MTSTAFEKCNAQAQAKQREVIALFTNAGLFVRSPFANARNDFEVQFPYGTERIELKCEDRFADSGNICVEMWQGKSGSRPAGIEATEATVCVHTLGDKYVAYRVVPMRNWLQKRLGGDMGIVTTKTFGKADNGNGGSVIERILICTKEWGDEGPLEQLPQSKVFTAARVPA